MKTLIKIAEILILAAFLTITGCSPRIYTAGRDTVIRVNTQVIEKLKTDTVLVELPFDSVSVVIPCDTVSNLNIGVASSTASIQDGKLHHSLWSNKNYKDTIALYHIDTLIIRDSAFIANSDNIVEVEKPLTGWQKFIQAWGQITLGAVAIVLLYISIRIFIRAYKQ